MNKREQKKLLQEIEKAESLGELKYICGENGAEGNGYGTIKIGQSFWVDNKALFIQPFEEHLDYEELQEEK